MSLLDYLENPGGADAFGSAASPVLPQRQQQQQLSSSSLQLDQPTLQQRKETAFVPTLPHQTRQQNDALTDLAQTGGDMQQPIFTLDPVQFQFPGKLLTMVVANNVLMMSLENMKLLRIRLDEAHIIEDIELPRKAKEQVADNVQSVFLDPTGRHCIVSTQLGENYYLWCRWKRAKLLPKWRGINVSAVAWNKAAMGKDTLSTLPILFGSSQGNIYETEISPSDPEGNNATAAPSLFWRSSSASGTDDTKYFRLVFTLPALSAGSDAAPTADAVTGIHFESFLAEPQKYVIFISSRQRLYEVIGKSSAYADVGGGATGSGSQGLSEISVFESIFARHGAGTDDIALVKLPPMPTGTALTCQCPVFGNTQLGAAQKLSWLTGQGIYQGPLSYGSQAAGGSVVDGLKVFEYPSASSLVPPKPATSNSAGAPVSEYPFALHLTEFHYILVYPDRVKAAWALESPDIHDGADSTEAGQATDSPNPSSHPALQAVWERLLPVANDDVKGFVADVLGRTYWLYTSSSVYELAITHEDRDVWRFYLDRNMFDNAMAFAKTSAQKSLIRKLQAEYYFNSGRYVLSAKYFAQCLAQVSFEDVTLKFIERHEQEALRTYLTLVLERLAKRQEFVQVTMVATWLLEINLDKLNRAEELAQQEGADNAAKQELTVLLADVRAFLTSYQGHLDPKTTYALMVSLGRVQEMLFFAQLIGDFERMLEHWVSEEQWSKVLELLARLMNPDLYYQFAPVLMEHVPVETVSLWMRVGDLDIKSLFPALLRYSPSNNPPDVAEHQVMRYLEHVIRKQGDQSTALHNYYLCLLVRQEGEDADAKLLAYLTDQTTGTHYSVEFALRQCLEFKKTEACVYLFGEMEHYEEATNNLDLSQIYADKPLENETLRKKLWLKIARYIVEQRQDIKQAMLFLNRSDLLKIEDILPFFPDFVLIDEFKDEIIEALEEYNRHLLDLNAKMEETSGSAQRLRAQLDDMRHQYVVVSKLDLCQHCHESTCNPATGVIRSFYVFPCGHVFHGQCLFDRAVQVLPSRLARRLRDIHGTLAREAPVSRLDMLKNTISTGISMGMSMGIGMSAGGASDGLGTPTSATGPQGSLASGQVLAANGGSAAAAAASTGQAVDQANAHSAAVAAAALTASRVERLRTELDELLGGDCVLCGDSMIRSIETAFVGAGDEAQLASWSLSMGLITLHSLKWRASFIRITLLFGIAVLVLRSSVGVFQPAASNTVYDEAYHAAEHLVSKKQPQPSLRASPPKVWRQLEPLTALSTDSQGCFEKSASSRLKVVGSKGMTVNTTAFASTFRDHFPFKHTAKDWAGMSGSGVWIDSHQVYVTTTRMILKPEGCADPCSWPKESVVYLQAWDAEFRPVSLRYQVGDYDLVGIPPEGRIVNVYDFSSFVLTRGGRSGILSMMVVRFVTTPGDMVRGPEDARLNADDYGHLILTFNMQDTTGRHYWSFNMTDHQLVHLRPEKEKDTMQKNWAPFVIDNDLHFVYSFQPLRVLKCDRHNADCEFVVGRNKTGVSALRGGTPFRRYGNTDYFVGIPRTAQDCGHGCGRVYRPNIAILHAPRVSPDSKQIDYDRMDLVYVSEPIDFEYVPLMPPHVPTALSGLCGTYIIPCGFLRWDLSADGRSDEALVEVSVQDSINVIVKVQGLEQLVVDAIAGAEERRRSSQAEWARVAPTQVKCAEQTFAEMCPKE
ncbi:tethering complex subunit [Sorochytrium milnesiophthora]